MGRSRKLRFYLSFSFILLGATANASTYIEAGTGLGSFSKADTFFQQAAASSTNSGFVGSLSIYTPITHERRLGHLDLGLQTRFSTSSISSTSDPLAMGSLHLGVRLEIWRFFVGAGYSPLTWVSKAQEGLTSLHLNSGTHAYMGEAGLIWRVIPEFQIAAAMSLEYGTGSNGLSPSPITEYGLRFRFPLNPKESGPGAGGVDFDGFRYPFGVMK
jgi:hypothetical protein